MLLTALKCIRRRIRWRSLLMSYATLAIAVCLCMAVTTLASHSAVKRDAICWIIDDISNQYARIRNAYPKIATEETIRTVVVVNACGTVAAQDIQRCIAELGATVVTSIPPQTDFWKHAKAWAGNTFAVAPCIVVCETDHWTSGRSALGGWRVYLCCGRHTWLLIFFPTRISLYHDTVAYRHGRCNRKFYNIPARGWNERPCG